jgi:hypothetical protein
MGADSQPLACDTVRILSNRTWCLDLVHFVVLTSSDKLNELRDLVFGYRYL